jgi:chitin disaccharide deacetylase
MAASIQPGPASAPARVLVVSADDFGRSAGINAGVMKAHEEGIVTSAGLMVRWPDATEAVAYARRRPELSLGLHLDFGEWVYRDEEWRTVYEVVSLEDPDGVEVEARAQLETFRRLTGADPTHIDSHQHVHTRLHSAPIVRALGAELGVPVRELSGDLGYWGRFYGQSVKGEAVPEGITVEGLIDLLALLPPGTTEIGCHPALGDDTGSAYGQERVRELETLCDPRVAAAIESEGIVLRSFAQIAEHAVG